MRFTAGNYQSLEKVTNRCLYGMFCLFSFDCLYGMFCFIDSILLTQEKSMSAVSVMNVVCVFFILLLFFLRPCSRRDFRQYLTPESSTSFLPFPFLPSANGTPRQKSKSAELAGSSLACLPGLIRKLPQTTSFRD